MANTKRRRNAKMVQAENQQARAKRNRAVVAEIASLERNHGNVEYIGHLPVLNCTHCDYRGYCNKVSITDAPCWND